MAEMETGPKLKMTITQRQELRLKQVPRLIQTAELLQKSAIELERFIRTELIENPFLEVGEAQVPEDAGLHSEDSIATIEEEGRVGREFARLEELSDYFERLGGERPRVFARSNDDEGGKQELLQSTAQPATLHDYLLEQLRFLSLDDDIRRAAEHIIYCINEEGYFLGELDDVALECEVTPEVAEAALSVVQSLEPPGVGARDIVECLLLQVRDEKRYELVRRIIKDHLEDILKNRLPRIARETGEPMEKVKEGRVHKTPSSAPRASGRRRRSTARPRRCHHPTLERRLRSHSRGCEHTAREALSRVEGVAQRRKGERRCPTLPAPQIRTGAEPHQRY